MAHLVEYEEASARAGKQPMRENFAQAALCAIAVANRKSSKSAAWSWAETAADWAVQAGIEGAHDLIEGGRYPEFNKFIKKLKEVMK